ncbi:hypothetical protein OUZ56_004811 [Daphnia magna]|uniref:Uncharacterized protein n=1 Tax=Daphnia magna TaxID=35525 RepID=A0ABQ9YRA3_9CRUS|nr:hypothetical protein OUZ56_004811 [Daphnia magna]
MRVLIVRIQQGDDSSSSAYVHNSRSARPIHFLPCRERIIYTGFPSLHPEGLSEMMTVHADRRRQGRGRLDDPLQVGTSRR